MEVEASCDYCNEKPAVTTCEVCGSKICSEHDRDYGCDVCKGGETRF